jgi:two-component system OmpR family response regulator
MHILIVDDDRTTIAVVRKTLSDAGHDVDSAYDANEARERASKNDYDLFILDRILPILDGMALFKELRAAHPGTAVLFLTAKGAVEDRIEGLVEGADDYIAKPFALGELLARVNSVLRRSRGSGSNTPLWKIDTLQCDPVSREVTRSGTKIVLQPREFKILEVLMRNIRRIVSKPQLLREVWGLQFDPGTSVVQTNVSRLRTKIDLPGERPLIHTLRGFGYKLDDKV